MEPYCPGYGLDGVPKHVATGDMWDYLVKISEGAERNCKGRALHQASWRWSALYPRYDIALSYASMAGDMYRSVHIEDAEIVKVRQRHLHKMRYWYERFLESYSEIRALNLLKKQTPCGYRNYSMYKG